MGHGHGAAFFGLRLGDAAVGFSLVGLQLRADVAAYVDVGNINGEDLVRGALVQALFQHGLGNGVGVLQHGLVSDGGTDGGDDALADAGDDGFLAGAAHQALDVGAHGHAGLGAQLDTVLGHSGHGGRFNHLGQHAHLHGLEHVAAGQVDGAGGGEAQVDAGLLGGNQGVDDALDVTARQEVGFQHIGGHVQPGLPGFDVGVHDLLGRDAAEPHTDQGADLHRRAGRPGVDPQAQGHIPEEYRYQHNGDHDDHGNEYEHFRHGMNLLYTCFSAFNPAEGTEKSEYRVQSTENIPFQIRIPQGADHSI